MKAGVTVRSAKKLWLIVIFALLLCLPYAGRGFSALEKRLLSGIEDKRMKNVIVTDITDASETSADSHTEPLAEPVMTSGSSVSSDTSSGTVTQLEPMELPDMEQDSDNEAQTETQPKADDGCIKETTIRGGLSIKNETDYWVDAAQIITDGPGITLPSDQPQILIIHTHSSEAYTQAGLDRYESSDTNRTENTEYNIVRIGDELTAILQDNGLSVIHDRGIYDYPSYTGSYTRSGEAVSQYLNDYPSIRIVLDIHRDALGSDGVVYKTMAEEDGVCASQIMLLVGSDKSGLNHPNWRNNLALALYLQNTVNLVNPTLMRPVDLVPQRYNQQLSPGSLIVEVGSSGNTLQEALAAIRLFGNAVAPALSELVEVPAEE